MQMPIGEGPLSVPMGPADGGTPCWEGSTNSNCVKGKAESVNGYEVVRWEYNDIDGTLTRAWVSTKLRFPLRVEGDNGSSMELTGVAEGPQPASLFGIPSGYKKMEVDDFPGFSHGGGGLASAMANIPPDVKAAMAAAARGNTSAAMGPTGSGWEKTKGWVINIIVTGSGASAGKNWKETFSTKVTAAVPLNQGSPSIGMAGAPGPFWGLTGVDGVGTPEALAAPVILKVESEAKLDSENGAACMVAQDAAKRFATLKTNDEIRGTIAKPKKELGVVQGIFKISWDLKTYDVMASIGSQSVPETIMTRVEGVSCDNGKPYTRLEPTAPHTKLTYAIKIDYKGLPLPTAVGPVSGSQKAKLTLGGRDVDATVNWTITPIR